MIQTYLLLLGWLSGAWQRLAPAPVRRLLVDDQGDLTTTVAWLLGIAVIAGVGVAIYNGIIAPNLSAATTKASGLVNSIP